MAGDYDPDTTGDFDENTLDGSEGLDADHMTGDGENYVMTPPDRWRGAEPHDTLDRRLAEEKPDIDPDDEGVEEEEDYRQHMKKVLKMRQRLQPVRLEVQGDLDKKLEELVASELGLEPRRVFHVGRPLDLGS